MLVLQVCVRSSVPRKFRNTPWMLDQFPSSSKLIVGTPSQSRGPNGSWTTSNHLPSNDMYLTGCNKKLSTRFHMNLYEVQHFQIHIINKCAEILLKSPDMIS